MALYAEASGSAPGPGIIGAPRIAIVAGEASGDMLGAGLIAALRRIYPNAVFEGIGGPRMLEHGFDSLFAMDRLAVMGLVEPLKRLPELLGVRRKLRNRFWANPPDVFIGIDAPEFNTGLELSLRERGIKTVHYVSPSVWAWRQGRIKKIAKAVDLMLTLLPFEAQFYRQHQVPVEFVGHPLADEIPLHTDVSAARAQLGLADNGSGCTYVALLPGSRAAEVEQLGQLMVEVAQFCLTHRPELKFLIPSANDKRHGQLQQLLDAHGQSLPITLFSGRSHEVMAAADVVVMASGTTTLEAMLLKKPMVIAYKLAPVSYWLFSKLVQVKSIGLPNLLAPRPLVPEFIQQQATITNLGEAVLAWLNDPRAVATVQQEFAVIHEQLKRGASEKAANAVAALIEGRGP